MIRPKYLIGTLFEEEEIDQKQNLNNMKNKDPMGNTRWQGAFTGGFSAGFKNTCGSKQGWQPAQFVSSVSKRAEKKEQNIRDFMDKEDLGRQSIGSNIQVNKNFTATAGRKQNPFNIVVEKSIGQNILNKLRKQKAVESVPQNQQDLDKLLKFYEHQDMLDESVQQSTFQHYRDLQKPFSVGGSEINVEEDEFIENYEQLYRKVIRATVKEESQEERQKRIEQNKIYFDFSKPIEQQPQYLREIHQIQDLEKPKKRKKNLLNMLKLKDVFAPSVEFKQFTKESNIERAPQDYDPYHRIRDIKDFMFGQKKQVEPEEQPKPKHRIHSIQQRADILGFEKLANKFRSATTFQQSKKGSQNAHNSNQVVKYFENEKKNQRYIDYVEELQGRKIAMQHEYLSYEQAQKEREEFQIMYKKQKELKNQLSSKQQSYQLKHGTKLPEELEKILAAKKQEQTKLTITRTVFAWRPSQLLCKRFDCLLPYKIQSSHDKKQQQYF